MNEFATAYLGGILLGVVASLMLLLNGRVLGISGIYSHLLSRSMPQMKWQFFFVMGLVAGGFVLKAILPNAIGTPPVTSATVSLLVGSLVGLGTRFGNGCTSGHGICGVGRFSRRSILATFIFITTGSITATLLW